MTPLSRPHNSRELYFRLLGYVRPYYKVFAVAVLGMVLAAATEPLFPALIKLLLDGASASGGPSWPPSAFGAAIMDETAASAARVIKRRCVFLVIFVPLVKGRCLEVPAAMAFTRERAVQDQTGSKK